MMKFSFREEHICLNPILYLMTIKVNHVFKFNHLVKLANALITIKVNHVFKLSNAFTTIKFSRVTY